MFKALKGATVAIVGNGPSGTDQGAKIDVCDFVIRMSRWKTQGPKGAGSKASALCGCDNHIEIPPEINENKKWTIWCNEPPSSIIFSGPDHTHPANIKWLVETADGRILRFVRNSTHAEVTAKLREISLFRKFPPRADIGIIALAMALDLGADHIHIWGYDRTGFGKYNDNWAQEELKDPFDQHNHDYRARAVLLAELVDKHLWCGRAVDVKKIVWHGRPDMPKLEPDIVL